MNHVLRKYRNNLIRHLSSVNKHEMRAKGNARHAISLLALEPRETKSLPRGRPYGGRKSPSKINESDRKGKPKFPPKEDTGRT